MTAHRRELVVSGVLQYEPNMRIQALPNIVHRPAESVLLKWTECSHPLSSSWYFVHPGTGTKQVLTPMHGHARCRSVEGRACYFRGKDKRESILDIFTIPDFCEYAKARTDCVQCVMAVLVVSTASGAADVLGALT